MRPRSFVDERVRKFEEEVLFNDKKCHIGQLGHKMIAMILSYFIESSEPRSGLVDGR